MQENIREELSNGKSRYEKGMELYKLGKVYFAKGMYKVNGYEVDLRTPVKCECPDFTNRKQACKHIFAAELFSKNRGKAKIEHLNGNGTNSENRPENGCNKPQEAHSKDFDKQATITRLAVINSAIEILKTHRKALEIQEVIALASQLEKWTLGK